MSDNSLLGDKKIISEEENHIDIGNGQKSDLSAAD